MKISSYSDVFVKGLIKLRTPASKKWMPNQNFNKAVFSNDWKKPIQKSDEIFFTHTKGEVPWGFGLRYFKEVLKNIICQIYIYLTGGGSYFNSPLK